MRSHLKIKAYFILVAWLAIFMHNAIPHHHINENTEGCHELIHNTGEGNNDSGMSFSLTSQPSETKVCHISGFLFHSFNPENLIVHPVKDLNFSPELIKNIFITNTDQSFLPEHLNGSVSFRAPPSV